MNRVTASLSFACLSISFAICAQDNSFALHDGDRVVFYGDSITDNSPYTYFVEAFVSLRYPNLDATFMNAGVGGDRVTGGWMGPIDERMTRGLFSRKPTVVTSMLGMNDGSYRAYDPSVFDTYQKGYEHMVDRMRKEAPGARVYLILPSPYDDVTRAPGWTPGYNDVLIKYGDFLQKLAATNSYSTIDFNSPMVAMLKAANGANADLAKKILPDRVHPAPAGHLVMAEQILLAWHASPMVSDTRIDWATGGNSAVNATVSGWNDGNFTLAERTLPMPFDRAQAETALVLKSSDVETALNHERLQVSNMPAGNYDLKIDGASVGTFSASDFNAGIDLAALPTPMVKQAQQVEDMTNRLGSIRYSRWRNFEFEQQDLNLREKQDAVNGIEKLERALTAQRRKAAQPVPHKFDIEKVG